MAVVDHLKTAVAVGGLVVGVWGAGLTFGKSGEVAAVSVRQNALEKSQDQLRADVKESLQRQEATVQQAATSAEKAADNAEQTRKLVEKAVHGGVLSAKGKQP